MSGHPGRVCAHASRCRSLRHGVVVTFAVLLAACAGSGAASAPGAKPTAPMISVTVRSAGPMRTVRIRSGSTVAQALAAAGVTPAGGRLLSVLTHRVLGDDHEPATISLDGRTATPSTAIEHTATLSVRSGKDATERLSSATVAVRPPGLPRALSQVRTPGRPGRSRVLQGAISGEVVRSTVQRAADPSSPVGGKPVSLTFDDGPWPAGTPQILAILRAKNVRAVFCLIGRQVRQYPEIVRSELAAGHQICNHTLSHDEHLSTAPPERVEAEIGGGLDAITGEDLPAPAYYRPPGGRLSATVYTSAEKRGEQVLYWSLDPGDWRKPPAVTIVDRVMTRVKPGAIVLLHDGGGDRSATIAALPILIDRLRLAGYTFTMPLNPRGPQRDQ